MGQNSDRKPSFQGVINIVGHSMRLVDVDSTNKLATVAWRTDHCEEKSTFRSLLLEDAAESKMNQGEKNGYCSCHWTSAIMQ